MSSDLVKIQQRHDDFIDSLLANFERELTAILHAATARTQARLRDALSVKDGKIERSVKNTRTLRKLDLMFMDEMERAGYGHLLTELVNQFPGQLTFFQDTLDVLSESMKNPLPPVKFSSRDLSVFADQGLSAKDSLEAVMESIAGRAKQKVLLSVGGLSFADLAESLSTYLSRSLPEAVGLAETATATYYRTLADRGYQLIEGDLPEMEVRYKYEGPLDKLTRPFCSHLLNVDRSYTRAQIDDMDNGQIPNVFISAGGWRCRHQWVIALG
jgi:hypothetical protein